MPRDELEQRIADALLRDRPHWTPADLERRLRATGDAVELSLRHLDPAARHLLDHLAARPGAHTGAEAAAIAGIEPEEVARVLPVLVARALVERVLDERGSGRHSVPELVRRHVQGVR